MKLFYSLVLQLTLFASVNALGQEAWTLEMCVEHALENNLTLKQSALNLEATQSDLKQSKLNLLPSLNGNAGYSVNFGRGIDPQTNTFVTQTLNAANFGLSGSMTLFSGMQNINTIKQRQFQLLAGESSLQKAKDDILLAVVNGFLQVLFTKELVSVNEKALELSTQQLNRSKSLERAGSITRGDVLEIEAQRAQEELNLTNAQNNYEIARLTLIQLLDLNPNESFEISTPELEVNETFTEYNPEEVVLRAMEINPMVKQAEYNFFAAKKGEQVARGGLSPRLTLSGGVNTGYSDGRVEATSFTPASQQIGYVQDGNQTPVFQDFFIPSFETIPLKDQIPNNLGQNIGVSLFIPIFNKYQTRKQITRAKVNAKVAELNKEITQDNLEKTINQLIADRRAARKNYTATMNSFSSLEEAFKYNEEKFKVGLINSVDYNISKTNLARAQSQLLQAKYDLIFKTKILDYYMGQPITID